MEAPTVAATDIAPSIIDAFAAQREVARKKSIAAQEAREAEAAANPPQPVKLIISSSVLLRHVKALLPAVVKNPILPILENILFYMAITCGKLQVYIATPECATDEELTRLALNDGFDSVEEFTAWFEPVVAQTPEQRILFKLIHWTDYRY